MQTLLEYVHSTVAILQLVLKMSVRKEDPTQTKERRKRRIEIIAKYNKKQAIDIMTYRKIGIPTKNKNRRTLKW